MELSPRVDVTSHYIWQSILFPCLAPVPNTHDKKTNGQNSPIAEPQGTKTTSVMFETHHMTCQVTSMCPIPNPANLVRQPQLVLSALFEWVHGAVVSLLQTIARCLRVETCN